MSSLPLCKQPVSTSYLRDLLLTDQSCLASGVPGGSLLPAGTTHVDEPSSEYYDSPTYALQLINLPLQLLLSVPLATCRYLTRHSRRSLLRQRHQFNQIVRTSIPRHICVLFYDESYSAPTYGRPTNSKEGTGGIRSIAPTPPSIAQPVCGCHVSQVFLLFINWPLLAPLDRTMSKLHTPKDRAPPADTTRIGRAGC
jgi:hypothetical protein